MLDFPLVSVLMPLYNKEAYVEEAIKSVLNQTYPNIELIIVDDGSTDGSDSIAKRFISDKVELIRQVNRGVSKARNVAFEHSKGDFIQFLDADDVLDSRKIAEQVNILRGQSDTMLVISKRYYFKRQIDNAWQLPTMPLLEKDYDDMPTFLIDEITSSAFVHSWLIPRTLIQKSGKWNESMSIFEDRDFYLRLVLAATKIIYCPNAVCYCRFPLEDHQLKRSKKSNFEPVLHYFSKFEENLIAQNGEYNHNARLALACLHKKLLNITHDKKIIDALQFRSVRLGLVPNCREKSVIKFLEKTIGIKITFWLVFIKSKYIDKL